MSVCAAALAAPVGRAHADTLVYGGISVFSGQQSFVDTFTETTSGTLNITLSNMPWFDAVKNLTGFLSTSSGMIGTIIGEGSESLEIGPGTYYAHWFGEAQGSYNLGAVGMRITFQPNSVVPVALPPSLVLMLSGLGLLFGWQSRRVPGPVAA